MKIYCASESAVVRQLKHHGLDREKQPKKHTVLIHRNKVSLNQEQQQDTRRGKT